MTALDDTQRQGIVVIPFLSSSVKYEGTERACIRLIAGYVTVRCSAGVQLVLSWCSVGNQLCVWTFSWCSSSRTDLYDDVVDVTSISALDVVEMFS